MKAYSLIFLLLLLIFSAYGQVERQSRSGISMGVGSGYRGPDGAAGLNYYYNLPQLKNRIELNAGIGISSAAVYRAGFNYRLYDNSKSIEIYFSFSYSHLNAGEARGEDHDEDIGYYDISSIDYLHYFISSRYYVNSFAAFQLGLGYAQNISRYTIKHTAGFDLYYDELKNGIESGFMLSIELIVFPFGR